MRRQVRDFGDTAKALSKNPTGIIALFIVLIYGFAALVTTFTTSFTAAERLPLIYFLVIFPVLVLGVFAWLVKKGGLITPADFSDQTLFLQMLRLNIPGMQQREAVSDEEDRFTPVKNESLQLGVISDLYRRVDTEGFDGACKYIEQERDIHSKALRYRYLAIYFYTKKPDKLNCIKAALRYKDLEGDITDVYRFLGYVYWRFADFDTAIVYTEKALESIGKSHVEDRDWHIVKIRNNLAFYYAERGINSEKAFSYVDEIDPANIRDDNERVQHLDTKGYVYMKLGKSKEHIQKSIEYFDGALTIEENVDIRKRRDKAVELLENLDKAQN